MSSETVAVHRVGHVGGRGPLVVFIHGIEDSWQSWQRLASHLDPCWHCIALDMPWRAGNDYRWRRQHSPGGWLASALRELDRPVDLLVGHSFGAGAVLELLATGVTMRAAVLISPSFRPPDLEVTWRLFEKSRLHYEALIRQGLLLRLGPRQGLLDPGLRDAISDKALDRIGPVSFLTAFDQFTASGDLDLSSVTTPTLVLVGGQDPSLGLRGIRALQGRMPSATVIRAEGFDHFCHLRQAAAVAARLNSLIPASQLGGER